MADERITVSADTLEQLRRLSEPGQSLNEVVHALIQEHNLRELEARFQALEKVPAEELTPLDGL